MAKNDARLMAIGEVDEANCAIGVAIATLGSHPLNAELLTIQNDLFDLGADLATPGDQPGALRVVEAQVSRLEDAIDTATAQLQPLTSFILPGGNAGAAALHLARGVARRAERAAVTVVGLNPLALAYLNRLSDYLFVAARLCNDGGAADVLWRPGANR